MISTLAQRAWFAWQCLPRNSRGKPPPIARLELAHGLANAALRKVILGITTRPAHDSLLKMAEALQCDPQWLSCEKGPPPIPSALPNSSPPARRGRGISSRDFALFEGKAEKLAQRSPIRPRKIAHK